MKPKFKMTEVLYLQEYVIGNGKPGKEGMLVRPNSNQSQTLYPNISKYRIWLIGRRERPNQTLTLEGSGGEASHGEVT